MPLYDDLSEFVLATQAQQIDDNNWTVYCDKSVHGGAYHRCPGETEFQAKEYAFMQLRQEHETKAREADGNFGTYESDGEM